MAQREHRGWQNNNYQQYHPGYRSYSSNQTYVYDDNLNAFQSSSYYGYKGSNRSHSRSFGRDRSSKSSRSFRSNIVVVDGDTRPPLLPNPRYPKKSDAVIDSAVDSGVSHLSKESPRKRCRATIEASQKAKELDPSCEPTTKAPTKDVSEEKVSKSTSEGCPQPVVEKTVQPEQSNEEAGVRIEADVGQPSKQAIADSERSKSVQLAALTEAASDKRKQPTEMSPPSAETAQATVMAMSPSARVTPTARIPVSPAPSRASYAASRATSLPAAASASAATRGCSKPSTGENQSSEVSPAVSNAAPSTTVESESTRRENASLSPTSFVAKTMVPAPRFSTPANEKPSAAREGKSAVAPNKPDSDADRRISRRRASVTSSVGEAPANPEANGSEYYYLLHEIARMLPEDFVNLAASAANHADRERSDDHCARPAAGTWSAKQDAAGKSTDRKVHNHHSSDNGNRDVFNGSARSKISREDLPKELSGPRSQHRETNCVDRDGVKVIYGNGRRDPRLAKINVEDRNNPNSEEHLISKAREVKRTKSQSPMGRRDEQSLHACMHGAGKWNSLSPDDRNVSSREADSMRYAARPKPREPSSPGDKRCFDLHSAGSLRETAVGHERRRERGHDGSDRIVHSTWFIEDHKSTRLSDRSTAKRRSTEVGSPPAKYRRADAAPGDDNFGFRSPANAHRSSSSRCSGTVSKGFVGTSSVSDKAVPPETLDMSQEGTTGRSTSPSPSSISTSFEVNMAVEKERSHLVHPEEFNSASACSNTAAKRHSGDSTVSNDGRQPHIASTKGSVARLTVEDHKRMSGTSSIDELQLRERDCKDQSTPRSKRISETPNDEEGSDEVVSQKKDGKQLHPSKRVSETPNDEEGSNEVVSQKKDGKHLHPSKRVSETPNDEEGSNEVVSQKKDGKQLHTSKRVSETPNDEEGSNEVVSQKKDGKHPHPKETCEENGLSLPVVERRSCTEMTGKDARKNLKNGGFIGQSKKSKKEEPNDVGKKCSKTRERVSKYPDEQPSRQDCKRSQVDEDLSMAFPELTAVFIEKTVSRFLKKHLHKQTKKMRTKKERRNVSEGWDVVANPKRRKRRRIRAPVISSDESDADVTGPIVSRDDVAPLATPPPVNQDSAAEIFECHSTSAAPPQVIEIDSDDCAIVHMKVNAESERTVEKWLENVPTTAPSAASTNVESTLKCLAIPEQVGVAATGRPASPAFSSVSTASMRSRATAFLPPLVTPKTEEIEIMDIALSDDDAGVGGEAEATVQHYWSWFLEEEIEKVTELYDLYWLCDVTVKRFVERMMEARTITAESVRMREEQIARCHLLETYLTNCQDMENKKLDIGETLSDGDLFALIDKKLSEKMGRPVTGSAENFSLMKELRTLLMKRATGNKWKANKLIEEAGESFALFPSVVQALMFLDVPESCQAQPAAMMTSSRGYSPSPRTPPLAMAAEVHVKQEEEHLESALTLPRKLSLDSGCALSPRPSIDEVNLVTPTVYAEAPHVRSAYVKMEHACMGCSARAELKCRTCGKAFYCSRDCQMEHWVREHQDTCRAAI